MYRAIQEIIHAPLIEMDAIRLRQAIPAGSIEQISPFILLHHFDFMMEAGHNNFDVPPHPHRGFMPITFMYNGALQHEDSLGNAQVIGNDEVQWINAARGIIHSEKAGRAFVAKGGRFQGVQLWINLPKAEKMKTPSYQPLTKDEIILIEKEGVQFRLVSGSYEERKGPAHSNVLTAMMRMQQGSAYTLNLPAEENAIIYLLEGVIRINDEKDITQHDLAHFNQTDGDIQIKASSDAVLLVLSGRPIDEPLVRQGPYVMNSQTELLEAMRDFQQGKMGFLY